MCIDYQYDLCNKKTWNENDTIFISDGETQTLCDMDRYVTPDEAVKSLEHTIHIFRHHVKDNISFVKVSMNIVIKERFTAWPPENAGGYNSLTLAGRALLLAQSSSSCQTTLEAELNFFFI